MTKDLSKNNQSLMSVEQALESLMDHSLPTTKTQIIAIQNALGCVLYCDVKSSLNIPPKDNSAMDGYALNIGGYNDKTPLKVSNRISAGMPAAALLKNTAARIFTGAQIPAGANVVVKQEDCIVSNKTITVITAPKVGENIRRIGEDIKQGDVVLKKGHKIRAQDIGLLGSIGYSDIEVYQALKVAIFSTGNELVDPGVPLLEGQIYNSNRFVLLGLLANINVEVIDLGKIKDDFTNTQQTLLNASKQADLIITTGGVSVGEEDHVKSALESIGELMMWKVCMKPGKPLAFGRIGEAFFMGLPGNPVSAFAVFNLFVRPFLFTQMGQIGYKQKQCSLIADFNYANKGNRREYLRAKLIDNKVVIYPNQSSGVLSSVSWAHGFCCIGEGEIVQKGDLVNFIDFNQWT